MAGFEPAASFTQAVFFAAIVGRRVSCSQGIVGGGGLDLAQDLLEQYERVAGDHDGALEQERGLPTQVPSRSASPRADSLESQLQFAFQFTCVQHHPWRYTPCSDLHRWTLVDVRKRRTADS
jgi:hypothetical protein